MTDLRPILLAEDNLKDVELVLAALKKDHLANEVVVARDGAEALDYLYRRGNFRAREDGLPIAIFLDLKMPKVDGFDVLSWLNTRPDLKSLPVIVLSSSSREDDIERARELGADDYRVKPADFEDLLTLAKDVVSKWLGATKVPS